MAEQISERAKSTADALAHLQRTVRFFKLYPHDHGFCTQGLDDTFKALTAVFRAHGPLVAEVGNDGLYLDQELVLPESGGSGDLVTMLYFEAIREITLDVGMPKEELTTLVKILAAPYPEGNKQDVFADDLTTALWREDLHFLDYQTYDPLAAGTVRSSKQEGVMGVLMSRIRTIVESLGGSLEAGPDQAAPEGEPQALDSDGFLEKLLAQEGELDDKADWATHPDRALQDLESDKGRERKRLVDELSRAGQDDDLNRAAEVVAWSIDSQHPGVRDEDAARFIAGSTMHALNNGELEQATRLSNLVSQLVRGGSSVSALVSARLGSAEGIQALAKTLTLNSSKLAGKKMNEAGVAFLQRLGPTAAAAACESYAQVGDARVRRVLRDFLSTHVDDTADALGKLTSHKDATIAAEAAELLGSRGKDSPGFTMLQRLADQNVKAASDKVQELTGEAARHRLVRVVLTADARPSRLAAIGTLAKSPSARTYNELSVLLEGDAFFGREADELGALVDLLLACDPKRARALLNTLQALKVPLLRGRAETQRLKDAAAERLKRLGGAS